MDILNTVTEKLQLIPDLAIKFAPSILLALIIFIVGRIIVRKASTGVVKASQRVPNIDATLARFLGSLVLFLGMAAVIIMALSAIKINGRNRRCRRNRVINDAPLNP